ncbi:MAG: helix-turn-helix transcriptional regulator [Clostridia bacterium]|nr:helix-turn-helix transcriptional regulator [Clostridia bacterium]
MTLGEKIAKARKENNITQEQLADLLGVSRQAVGKWESDVSYPEIDKLIRMSKLFGVSLDYLLINGATRNTIETTDRTVTVQSQNITFTTQRTVFGRSFEYEYKSKKTLCGIPLVHINIGAGRTAKGIIAIGFKSVGLLSIGMLSCGLFSIGLLALGLIGLGVLGIGAFGFGAFALGLFAGGSVAIGVISFGAISVGTMSCGAISIGQFAIGALASGKYFAFGDDATAMVAIGATKASGTLYTYFTGMSNNYIGYDADAVISALESNVPSALKWFMDIALSIAGIR